MFCCFLLYLLEDFLLSIILPFNWIFYFFHHPFNIQEYLPPIFFGIGISIFIVLHFTAFIDIVLFSNILPLPLLLCCFVVVAWDPQYIRGRLVCSCLGSLCLRTENFTGVSHPPLPTFVRWDRTAIND